MITDELRQRRLEIIEEHFSSEVDKEFDRTIATFAGSPRYEIIPTGRIIEGEDDVLEYHRGQRTSFPDQRHENVRLHVADDAVIAEFDLLGTNLGDFYGMEPTGLAFRVPVIAVFHFEDDRITIERVYFDAASILQQIGRPELLVLAGTAAA